MKIGDRAQITRVYQPADVAGLSELAGGTRAASLETVPEPLIAGLFSYLLGRELPGFGTNYLKQQMRFHRPARIGEPITATVEITRIRPDKHLVDLATTCTAADGTVLCDGRALVLVEDVGHQLRRAAGE
ncbi:MAG: phosphate acetyltransferase [Candidatus Eiseniibacteriota bacterium]